MKELKFVHCEEGDGIAFAVGRSFLSVNLCGTIRKRRKSKNDLRCQIQIERMPVKQFDDLVRGNTYWIDNMASKFLEKTLFYGRFLVWDSCQFSVVDYTYKEIGSKCANKELFPISKV